MEVGVAVENVPAGDGQPESDVDSQTPTEIAAPDEPENTDMGGETRVPKEHSAVALAVEPEKIEMGGDTRVPKEHSAFALAVQLEKTDIGGETRVPKAGIAVTNASPSASSRRSEEPESQTKNARSKKAESKQGSETKSYRPSLKTLTAAEKLSAHLRQQLQHSGVNAPNIKNIDEVVCREQLEEMLNAFLTAERESMDDLQLRVSAFKAGIDRSKEMIDTMQHRPPVTNPFLHAHRAQQN
eukprot:4214761-Amphidinium_carterae.1